MAELSGQYRECLCALAASPSLTDNDALLAEPLELSKSFARQAVTSTRTHREGIGLARVSLLRGQSACYDPYRYVYTVHAARSWSIHDGGPLEVRELVCDRLAARRGFEPNSPVTAPEAAMSEAIRLTSFAHGGGCGCKLSPAFSPISSAHRRPRAAFSDLLVGNESWRRCGSLPAQRRAGAGRDHGLLHADRRRSARFRSDRRRPMHFPTCTRWGHGRSWRSRSSACRWARSLRTRAAGILAGGAAVCARAGVPVAGGHSIDSPEPIYGLVALGLVHPDA